MNLYEHCQTMCKEKFGRYYFEPLYDLAWSRALLVARTQDHVPTAEIHIEKHGCEKILEYYQFELDRILREDGDLLN